MAKPSMKSTRMSEMLDMISKKKFGRSRTECIAKDICLYCGKPAVNFKDELSRKEFSVSGLCSDCQDEVFGLKPKRGDKYAAKQKS